MNSNFSELLTSSELRSGLSSTKSILQSLNSVFSIYSHFFNKISDPLTENLDRIISSLTFKKNLSVRPLAIEFENRLDHKYEYLEFIHKIQKHKMKELWDNEVDEEWENA